MYFASIVLVFKIFILKVQICYLTTERGFLFPELLTYRTSEPVILLVSSSFPGEDLLPTRFLSLEQKSVWDYLGLNTRLET